MSSEPSVSDRPRKVDGRITVGEAHGFRPNTSIDRMVINFTFNDGGLGDYVNYAAATVWMAKNCPWIKGRVFTPRYLTPLMNDIHQPLGWEAFAGEDAEEHLEDGTSIMGPSVKINGKNANPQLYTVLGAHPIEVGFAYFAGMKAPVNAELPVLDYPSSRLPPKVKRLLGKYCVITTGSTTSARRVSGRHLNPIIEYVRDRDITPIFVGKEDFVGTGRLDVNFPTDINFAAGLDLRNNTSVKDAACIMQHAEFVLGLDNGLLHLASLMKDSRIIFGYNITSVEHREPKRSHGKTINIHLTDEELVCSGCQSKWRQMLTHRFDKCMYGDVKCVDMLFSGGRFEAAIDEMLK